MYVHTCIIQPFIPALVGDEGDGRLDKTVVADGNEVTDVYALGSDEVATMI